MCRASLTTDKVDLVLNPEECNLTGQTLSLLPRGH